MIWSPVKSIPYHKNDIVNGAKMKSDSIERYITEYGRDIYSFCMYTTRNKDDADDLYQQTFLIAYEKDEIDEGKNPKAYLITIAANIWNNHIRKKAWRRKSADVIYLEDNDFERLKDDARSVEEEVVSSDEEEAVRRVVRNLPEKQRIVILMYYMEEIPIKDIASALGIPEGTVKSRLNKAKEILKERLEHGERKS